MQILSAPDLVSSALFPCFLRTHTQSRIEQITVLWNASEEVARRDYKTCFNFPQCMWFLLMKSDSLDWQHRQNHAVSKWAAVDHRWPILWVYQSNFKPVNDTQRAELMSGSEWRCFWSHHVVALFAGEVQKLIWKFRTFNWRGWKSLYCLNRNQWRKTVFKAKCFRIQAGRLQPPLKRLRWVWVCWFLLTLHNRAT